MMTKPKKVQEIYSCNCDDRTKLLSFAFNSLSPSLEQPGGLETAVRLSLELGAFYQMTLAVVNVKNNEYHLCWNVGTKQYIIGRLWTNKVDSEPTNQTRVHGYFFNKIEQRCQMDETKLNGKPADLDRMERKRINAAYLKN